MGITELRDKTGPDERVLCAEPGCGEPYAHSGPSVFQESVLRHAGGYFPLDLGHSDEPFEFAFEGPTPPDSASSVEAYVQKQTCANCFTRKTPRWRITPEGRVLCGACGLFFRLHGEGSAGSLKVDMRSRRECSDSSSKRDGPVDVKQPLGIYPPVGGDKQRATPPPSAGTSQAESKTASFLASCIQQCAVVVRRLDVLEKLDHGEMAGFMLSLSLSVVELRLRLWAHIAAGLSDAAWPVQTMIEINGIICELDVVVNALLRDTRPEATPSPRTWDKIARSFEELVGLVNILHSELPEIWRETARWALVATLLVHRTAREISGGLRARIGSGAVNLFTVSLGPEVPRNLSSMFSLRETCADTAAPMSYEHGLLDPRSLADEGWADPGIRVYVERGSSGAPEKGLVAVETVACQPGETPKQAMESRSALALQRRLQLPKPAEFRVLALAGYVQSADMRRVEILYHVPRWAAPPYAPTSLARIAADGLLPPALAARVSVARKLAGAVLHLHACDWIHGDIVARNVVFFTPRGPPPRAPDLREPFLCNFAPRPAQDVARARARDVSQLAWVLLTLVLGDDAARRLRRLDPALLPEFRSALLRAAADAMARVEPAALFEAAVVSCLEDVEGVIAHDRDLAGLKGFYWRVVRPLDHCLALLESPLPALGKGRRERMADGGPEKVRIQSDTVFGHTMQNAGIETFYGQIFTKGVDDTDTSQHPSEAPPTVDSPSTAAEDGAEAAVPKLKPDADAQGKKKVYPVQTTPAALALWQETLLPQLERLLEQHLPARESASIDLLGLGVSRSASRPTIVITCQSARQLKPHLRRRFVYDALLFDLKVRSGEVRRSTGRRARRSTAAVVLDCPNRAYQQRPLSGASIGACLDGRPLPPGTYGGLILVDGQPYGMTVHHLLDPESEGEEDPETDEEEDGGEDFSAEGSSDCTMSPTNSDVDSMPVYWDDSSDEDDDDDTDDEAESSKESDSVCYSSAPGSATGDVGDIPGVPIHHEQDIVITQPAQYDVPDQEPFESRGTHRLGTILASSGIRRVRVGADKHEMDWALVQIEQQRLVARNIIKGGGRYLRGRGQRDLEPCAIVPMAELGEMRVHATGRTSGLQGGMVSQAMSSVRLHGRATFSRSWHVVGNLGIPGDSGAWVVGNDDGRICGHVLARCSIRRISYIVPMELLLEDIRTTLGAACVRLPSVATEVDQLMDEALARCGMRGSAGPGARRGVELVRCPPSPGGGDDITPFAC